MTEEIDDQDNIYHYDFTTETEWEIFIARLEKVIHKWKLSQVRKGPKLKKGDLTEGDWERESDKIYFADTEFNITHFNLKVSAAEEVVSPLDDENEEGLTQAMEDMMSIENDFPPQILSGDGNTLPQPHPLVRWYGLREFVVLAPTQVVASESKVKILLSSMYIAINNTSWSIQSKKLLNSLIDSLTSPPEDDREYLSKSIEEFNTFIVQVPMFVQIHDNMRWYYYYMGVHEAKGVRSEFEMVHLKVTPSHCKYLTGLLNLFKSKVGSPLPLDTVSVSVRFTYVLRDWTSNTWTQEPPDFDFLQGETLGVAEFGKLPFGASFDPVSELHLFATWPQLVESTVVDNESYSDFEPSQAPYWSVQVKMAEQPACLLSEYLTEFIQLCNSNRTMQDLLGGLIDRGAVDASNPLNVLTESRVPTISKVIKKAKGTSQQIIQEGPIADELLMPILYFLFPDAVDEPQHPYSELLGNPSGCDNKQEEELLSGLKSAPVDGLVWRLAVVMSHVVHTNGGVGAAAHIWYEFSQEMRYRWEKGIMIPGVTPGYPDTRTCLLHQKLQMLNCCVERRNMREKMARSSSVEKDDTESESDEEFFDCSADEPSGGSKDEVQHHRSRQKHSLWNQPVGRLGRHGNLRLIKTGEHLYIPITQEPSPKTEDQVQEDAEVLLQLGNDARGSEMRARMMSASLLSDMESFKAANPGAILEDFIRWYSPRDWIEEDEVDEYGQKKGTLSARMQIKGNMWVEVWEAAKPVPARRQKRLFDDTREAEKVLHFLDSQRPSAVAKLLLPVLIHAVICRLLEEQKEDLPMLPESIHRIIKIAERLTRNPKHSLRHYEDLASEVVGAEAVIAQANSLEHKFCSKDIAAESSELRTFLSKLMRQPEVEVPGGPRGPIGNKIRTMFSEAQKAAQMVTDAEPINNVSEEAPWSSKSTNYPRPSTREFVMRVMAARPAPTSCLTPQKLYACLRRNEFRLAGCFSQDTTFQ